MTERINVFLKAMLHWQVKHESFHVSSNCKSFIKVFHFHEILSWKCFAFIKVFHYRASVSWKSFNVSASDFLFHFHVSLACVT